MDLAELEKLIAKLRTLGVQSFKGELSGHPVEIHLGELPRGEAKSVGPSDAKRKEDRIRRELDTQWAHVGGPPQHVLKAALEDAETERPEEPHDEDLS